MYGTYPYGASLYGSIVTPTSSDPVFSTLQFNLLDLQSANIITSRIDYSTAPERELDINSSPRAHGEFINSAYWRRKVITIEGVAKADTMAELEMLMDNVKKALNVETGTLYVTMPSGEVRTHACTWVGTEAIFAGRQAYNVTFMPFTISLECITPFGLSQESEYVAELGATTTKTLSVYNEGSADTKPQMVIGINSVTNLSQIVITHNETGRVLTLDDLTDTAPTAIVIDMEALEVTQDGSVVDFSGQFLPCQAGGNNYEVAIVADSHSSDITILWKNSYL